MNHVDELLRNVIDENQLKTATQDRLLKHMQTRDKILKIAAYGAVDGNADEASKRRFEKIWRLLSRI